MENLLTQAQREALLPALAESGWNAAASGDALHKIWKFKNFSAAWAFMSRVALASEKADHHPDWRNIWNWVEITLSTHSAGGLTQQDIDLATRIDSFAQGIPTEATDQPITRLFAFPG